MVVKGHQAGSSLIWIQGVLRPRPFKRCFLVAFKNLHCTSWKVLVQLTSSGRAKIGDPHPVPIWASCRLMPSNWTAQGASSSERSPIAQRWKSSENTTLLNTLKIQKEHFRNPFLWFFETYLIPPKNLQATKTMPKTSKNHQKPSFFGSSEADWTPEVPDLPLHGRGKAFGSRPSRPSSRYVSPVETGCPMRPLHWPWRPRSWNVVKKTHSDLGLVWNSLV